MVNYKNVSGCGERWREGGGRFLYEKFEDVFGIFKGLNKVSVIFILVFFRRVIYVFDEYF